MDILQGRNYFSTQNGQQYGPFESAELIDMARNSRLLAEDLIWTEGMENWLPASSFAQLAPCFTPAQSSAPASPQVAPAQPPVMPRQSPAKKGSPYFKDTVPGSLPATGPAAPAKTLSKTALFSFILGVLSIIASCFLQYAAVIAIVLAVAAIVAVKKSDGALRGMGFGVAGLILGIIGLGFGLKAGQMRKAYNRAVVAGEIKPAGPILPDPLDEVESKIRIGDPENRDLIGFGNTTRAADLATSFATKMKVYRKTLFTGDPNAFSLSGGEFLTYCQINENSCAFVFHAPGLRKYNSEAKDALSDIAWALASSLLIESGIEVEKMAVAMKGMVLYHRVDIGSLSDTASPDDLKSGISSSSDDEETLHPFFPRPAGEAETPPKTKSVNSE